MLLPLHDDNPTTRIPFVTFGLIGINVAIMLWLSMLSPVDQHVEVIKHGFIPERIEQFADPNVVVDVQVVMTNDEGQPLDEPGTVHDLRLPPDRVQILTSALTSMFLHGGWLHLGGNMWFLWIFGNNVEERLGPLKYLPFYLAGGLLATACHWAYNPHSTVPVIGASGAVATILGAYAVTWPKANVRTLVFLGIVAFIEIPAMAWLGLWFVGELASAFFIGKDLTVAVWAHIGGFVTGACLMPILSYGTSPRHVSGNEQRPGHFTIPPADRF